MALGSIPTSPVTVESEGAADDAEFEKDKKYKIEIVIEAIAFLLFFLLYQYPAI
jgi:hypothetical protein